jgi:hypothetical protein
MKNILALALLTVTLAGSALVFIHYKHKHEDDVAYFALRAIKKGLADIDATCGTPDVYQEHCLSTKAEMQTWLNERPLATTNDLLIESMDCLTRNGDRKLSAMDACHQHTNELQADEFKEWAEKYPRQVANLKRDALDNERKQDGIQQAEGGR